MSQVTEIKSRLQSILDENDRIEKVIAEKDENGIVVSKEQATTYRKNLAEARELKGLLDDMEGGAELKAYLQQTPESKGLGAAAAAAGAAGGEGSGLWVPGHGPANLGRMFTESEEFKSLVRSGAATMPSAWEIEGVDATALVGQGTYGVKDVYAGMGGALHDTSHGFGKVQFDPTVPRNMRRARVRDLFPVAQTSANLIDFFRVLGFGTDRLDLSSSASVVPDYAAGNFGLKPHSALKFENAQASVRTIAHYEVAHRNVLQDEPQLQSTINNELLYGLRLTEDAQILNGTGTGEDLLGILRTPGIQSYDQSTNASDKKQDALRRAATKAILAYYDPTGVVLHPYDWEEIELDKGTDGHYSVAVSVAMGAEQKIWRMPVVDSPAIAQGTALVGAFGLGAQLYDRMQANIRIAEQHADFFIRNAVAILAEERLALAVKRPESFVKVNFS
ncbi:phage major capsid protein [Phycicoccus sp.]|uniref:phage major capsid protein n=1 Tax=Phycicoccus sp. TaxID=1902410 RepID=UPI002C4E9D75|nr:phage major capsid protein [Phycicoccus sp.]HMM95391.1 phage major capsid protein [Phycicoccus sp.]